MKKSSHAKSNSHAYLHVYLCLALQQKDKILHFLALEFPHTSDQRKYMSLLIKLTLSFLFILPSIGFSQSKIYGKNLNGTEIWVEGFIDTPPKFHTGYGGKYQSWTFRVNASSERVHGDEFIMITFHTVKWGKTVGTFNFSKGEKVKLFGKYREFQGTRRGTGIVGSLAVNDLSIKQVK